MKKLILLFTASLFCLSANAQVHIATHFDNDLLYIPANDDREYTHGQSLLLSWQRKRKGHIKRFATLKTAVRLYTPDNLSAKKPSRRDRPYASLLNFQGHSWRLNQRKARLWENRAELGFMGLKFPTQFQVKAHAMTRNLREANFPAHPEGWHTQISNGGEASLNLSTSLKQGIAQNLLPRFLQLSSQSEAQLGSQSKLFQGLGLRFGKIRSTQWVPASRPDVSLPIKGESEWFFYTQGGLRYQLYNALLQGQFKDSHYVIPASQLKRKVWEAELGAIYRGSHFHTGYGLHFGTTEYERSRLAMHYWGVIFVGWTL
ncbi:MAG: lipid A-modifier LpxR family protein [Bacteroidota bacterium]